MKKKIIIAVLTSAVLLLLLLAVFSYRIVKKKLNMQTARQNTIELEKKEETEESVQEKLSHKEEEGDQTSAKEALKEEDNIEEKDGVKKELPVITLKTDRVEIKVGESFDELAPVQEVSDNKDSREELNRRIRVRGEYDVYTPGEYTLKYFVTDTEEYQSEIKELKLIVTAE